MNERRMQFAIGLVTLISAFALGAIVIWFGEFQFVIQERKSYFVSVDRADGVRPRIPIRRAGIRIGEVREVDYDEQFDKVILSIVIEGDNNLRAGDVPVIKSANLFGDAYIDIETAEEARGKPDRPVLPPNTILEGKPLIGITKTFEKASDLIPEANRTLGRFSDLSETWNRVGLRTDRLIAQNEEKLNNIVNETQTSVQRLAETLENVNQVLDEESQKNLKETLENVRVASEELEPMIKSSRQAIEQITETTSKLDEVAVNLQKATKPLAERSENTFRNLEEVSDNLNLLLADIQSMTKQIRTQDGTLQRLVKDPSLYQQLDDGSLLLVKNLAHLDKILEDLRVFADKIARHPGELGAQGIITRDSGLKNARPGIFRKTGGLLE